MRSNRFKPFPDLTSYILFLEERGELIRIREEVDPYLEIAAVAQEAVRAKGPALLFERCKGADYPLVINLFATSERITWALGREPAAIAEEFLQIIDNLRKPPSLRTLKSLITTGMRILRARPRVRSYAPVQSIIEEPDLRKLPILTCWPEDGGPFITFGTVLTQHPEIETRNLGLYRMHVYDEKTTGMHWQSMKGGRGHYAIAEKLGKPLPVAVILGGDPVLMISSVLPLPEEVDEILWAGLIRGRGIPMARAHTIPLNVPANAEFILEGEVPPQERRLEGPFGDHFGHYSAAHPFPVFHLKAITRRPSPVYPAAVVGKPPQEDWALGIAAGEMMGPLVRVIFPAVHRLWASPAAGFHHLLVVSVDERHPREALKIGLGLLGQGQLSLTKVLILVPKDVDPSNGIRVLEHLWYHFRPESDLLLLPTAPADTLDFTSPTLHTGSKVILNGLGPKVRHEPPPDSCPLKPDNLHAGARNLRWLPGGALIVQVRGSVNVPSFLDEILTHPWVQKHALWVVAVSEDIPLDDPVLLVWGIFTRFDPALDGYVRNKRWENLQPIYPNPIGINATWKPHYPKPLEYPSELKIHAQRKFQRWWK